jgi:hypothetical protein
MTNKEGVERDTELEWLQSFVTESTATYEGERRVLSTWLITGIPSFMFVVFVGQYDHTTLLVLFCFTIFNPLLLVAIRKFYIFRALRAVKKHRNNYRGAPSAQRGQS